VSCGLAFRGDEFAIGHVSIRPQSSSPTTAPNSLWLSGQALEVEGRELLTTLRGGFSSYPQEGAS